MLRYEEYNKCHRLVDSVEDDDLVSNNVIFPLIDVVSCDVMEIESRSTDEYFQSYDAWNDRRTTR